MQSRKKVFVLWFKEITLKDVPLVGGKNAALGEMYSHLTELGINVPNGFAITAAAYNYFLKKAGLEKKIKDALKGLDTGNLEELHNCGKKVRELILNAELPDDLREEIVKTYRELGDNLHVAVRSSATAEDLPGASFAGQQETFLNISGADSLLTAVRKCIASLFTDRAISYRVDKGFANFKIALSVGVQKMVRSDLSSSGVMFTIDTESGFDKVVVIEGLWGLGEMIVQGKVTPDEFQIYKPSLAKGLKCILSKTLGQKDKKLVYSEHGTREEEVDKKEQSEFCLTDREAKKMAEWGVKIEEFFSKKHKRYQPMDIEWAKDGRTGELFIVQARPETIHSAQDKNIYKEYRLTGKGRTVLEGVAVGAKIASGLAKIINNPKEIGRFNQGEVLVTDVTDPDWEPIMKMASAIVTDKGGRTSHAAIVSRELGIPCIVGSKSATRDLQDGQEYTVDCAGGEIGKVYAGKVSFEVLEHNLKKIPKTKTHIMVNIGSPDEAFKNHLLPVKGVGLGRLEFIIASHIKIHPNALIDYHKIKEQSEHRPELRKIIHEIDKLTQGYEDKASYYVEKLMEGISKIGATFWPHPVIIRFSDFKTNEYSKLLGGELYEPKEENPMLGWRGASRYYHPQFIRAFGLECRAMKKVREEMGLGNVLPMIPFCRTPEEGRQVVEMMAEHCLDRKQDQELKIYVMCEIPSNILLADEFLKIFDGMSIGSNDLTQLVMGVDRDSDIVNKVTNENNPAVTSMIRDIIKKCRKQKKYIGICGQAPSDYPEFAEFLVKEKIESISLNPDSVIKTILAISHQETKLKNRANTHEDKSRRS